MGVEFFLYLRKATGMFLYLFCPIAVLVSGVVMVALGPIEKKVGLLSRPPPLFDRKGTILFNGIWACFDRLIYDFPLL